MSLFKGEKPSLGTTIITSSASGDKPLTVLKDDGTTTVFSVDNSGNQVTTGTISQTGNFAVNTTAFTVNAVSGNASVGGSLNVVGNVTVNTNKVTMEPVSGNTVIAGTLGVTGLVTLTGGANVASGHVVAWNGDSGISRIGSAEVAVGNGSNGDTTGTIDAAHFHVLASSVPIIDIDSAGVGLVSNQVISFSSGSTNADATIDSGLSRTGVATIAVGNGTAGNTLGTIVGNVSVPTGRTAAIADADALTVNSIKIPTTWTIQALPTVVTPATSGWSWVANRDCKVTSVKEIHSASASGVTLNVRKINAVLPPGNAAGTNVKELLSSALAADSTVNTTVTGSLSATPSDYTFAAGDRLAWNASGALTSYLGQVIIEFQAV